MLANGKPTWATLVFCFIYIFIAACNAQGNYASHAIINEYSVFLVSKAAIRQKANLDSTSSELSFLNATLSH